MQTSSQIDLVCFDLGGVLVRICRSWDEGCRRAGVPVRGDSRGDRAARLRREFMGRFGIGEISEAEWAEGLSQALGGLYSPDELVRIHHAWTVNEYEGVADLIDELSARQVATACLSNTNSAHWRRLLHRDGEQALPGEPEYPTVRRLRHHLASHLVGLAKPEPTIFRCFEQQAQYFGSQILFFDDLAENVEAARGVGWHAECVNPSRETVPQLRHYLREYGVL